MAAPEKEWACERVAQRGENCGEWRCAEALAVSSPFKQDSAGVGPELGLQKTLLTNNNLWFPIAPADSESLTVHQSGTYNCSLIPNLFLFYNVCMEEIAKPFRNLLWLVSFVVFVWLLLFWVSLSIFSTLGNELMTLRKTWCKLFWHKVAGQYLVPYWLLFLLCLCSLYWCKMNFFTDLNVSST